MPTVIGVWRTRTGHEREIYDMMRIRFAGILISRILMWEGYRISVSEGFPVAGKQTVVAGSRLHKRAARRRPFVTRRAARTHRTRAARCGPGESTS